MSIADFEIEFPWFQALPTLANFDAASSGTSATADDGGRNHFYIIQ
jgi:hypothetical protein